jgi:hypothetical protein
LLHTLILAHFKGYARIKFGYIFCHSLA